MGVAVKVTGVQLPLPPFPRPFFPGQLAPCSTAIYRYVSYNLRVIDIDV